MKVFKVYQDEDFNPCYEKEISAIMLWLEKANEGNKIKIEVFEMTENEYNALPEYMGP